MTDRKTNAGSFASPASSDIALDSWLLRSSPAPLRPYLKLARLDRPIGTWLLLFPCWWSLALAAAAAGRWPDWSLMVLFAIGALVMRAAGCTVNDMADRKIDAQVARTATRPLASGQLSLFQAAVFLALLLAIGLVILLQLNGFTVALGASSLLLVAAYPFMKRITYWPQAWLGLTFNWGALMGWAAVEGMLGWPAVLLYLGGIAWTLGYDTIYAHQDKEDDALVGVKSTALRFGAASRIWIAIFYGLAVAFFLAAGLAAGLGWPFVAGLTLAGFHLAWQVAKLDIADPRRCLMLFRSNRFVGWLLLAGLLAAGLPD
jgi:4-hydroxybenzoate polyprenyltransferase